MSSDPTNQPLSSPKMLAGKSALVTGPTSGIGLGIAKALAANGANIMLNGFGDHSEAMRAIAALGVEVNYNGADMSRSLLGMSFLGRLGGYEVRDGKLILRR